MFAPAGIDAHPGAWERTGRLESEIGAIDVDGHSVTKHGIESQASIIIRGQEELIQRRKLAGISTTEAEENLHRFLGRQGAAA